MAEPGIAEADEQPFMVSSLPLVFCDGRPVALENMSDRSLVKFVRFMLKCALGVEESRLRTVTRPSWWPRTLPYFNFKTSSEVEKGHAARLRELVRCCYRGADCEYLIRFCADLERHCLAGRMVFKNNFDGSSSLIELATNRLVVTCRNENLDYDRSSHGPLSPRRHLRPRQLSRGGSQQLAMVQPPPDDIFLCDTCSAEFSSIDAVQAHERQCGVAETDEGPPCDAESDASEPEVQCASQTRFLSYVGLAPADGSGQEPYWSPSKRGGGAGAVARLRRGPGLLSRYPGVEVSSPLGRRLGAGPPPEDQQPPEHEKHCEDSERKRLARQPAFPVSWRPPRRGRRIVYGWSHPYCFTPAQRAERRRTIRTGLTDRARRLVQAVLPCSVRLCRVSPEEIEEACRPRPEPVPAEPVWEPPVSVQGLLWRPAQSLARPAPWRSSDPTAARSATSALSAAAAAAAATGGASALRAFRPLHTDLPARSGPSRGLSLPYSLPPGLTITPRPQVRRGPVWRPTLVAADGAVVRPALVRGRGVPPPFTAGAPRRGGLKVAVTPSRPTIGRETRDNDTVVIDLCSSSDEEGDPPPAAPPPPPPPTRIKRETADSLPAAASTNGSGWQPKNAHSHWSRSCGGLANGVSSFASLNAGRDGNGGASSEARMTASRADITTFLLTKDFSVSLTCADMDRRTAGARVLVAAAERDTSCDIRSERGQSTLDSSSLLSYAWKEITVPSAEDGHHDGLHNPDYTNEEEFCAGPGTEQQHTTSSRIGCEESIFSVGLAKNLVWTLVCHAA